MKSKSLSLALYFLTHFLVIEKTQCGILSAEENQKRIDNCGKSMLPIITTQFPYKDGVEIASKSTDFLVRIRQSLANGKIDNFDTTGTFISSRHIITSSEPVITESVTELLEMCRVLNADPKKMEVVAVDEQKLDGLVITTGICTSDSGCDGYQTEEYKAKDAWILAACWFASYPELAKRYFHQYKHVMIIEVDRENQNVIPPCLSHGSAEFHSTEIGHAYGLQYATNSPKSLQSLRYRNPTGFTNTRLLIRASKYLAYGDRGGPLVKMSDGDGRAILMGVGASAQIEKLLVVDYLRIDYVHTKICDITGICAAGKGIQSATTTTLELSTTTTTVTTTTVTHEPSTDSDQVLTSLGVDLNLTTSSIPTNGSDNSSTAGIIESTTTATTQKPIDNLPIRIGTPKPIKLEGKHAELEEEEEEVEYEGDMVPTLIVDEDFFDNGHAKRGTLLVIGIWLLIING